MSPIGVGVEAFTRALRQGRSGVRRLDPAMPGCERIKSRVAAECVDFDPAGVMGPADLRRLPRLVPMALTAAREAMAQARIPRFDSSTEQAILSRRVGLILGTGAGGIDFTLDQAQVGYGPGATRQPSLWTITNATHGNLAGELSIRLGLHGPSWCVSTGCASSSDAIGLAMETLRGGRPGAPDVFVVVGADAHVRWETLLGMEMLGVVSTRAFDEKHAGSTPWASASRPFDKSRDGFVLGEGAWAMVLEREEFAQRRGATPLARALGYGATCDAFHRVRPAPDMEECARAIRLALEDAGRAPNAVDVIHYHGTGTKINDSLETLAVKMALGERALRVRGHSIKGAIGHPQGACGVASAVATIACMTARDEPTGEEARADARGSWGGFLPPTINLDDPDVEGGCDLDYTPRRAVPRDGARTILVNCLAFGAKNSALVFELE